MAIDEDIGDNENAMMTIGSNVYAQRFILHWGIVLCMRPANERRCYIVMSSPNGWVFAQNDPCTEWLAVHLW